MNKTSRILLQERVKELKILIESRLTQIKNSEQAAQRIEESIRRTIEQIKEYEEEKALIEEDLNKD